MLARLQQLLVVFMSAAALAWAAWHRQSPVLAFGGAFAIVFSYALLLAFQCVMLWFVSRTDTPPQPGAAQLVKAWWAELVLVPQVFFWRQPFRAHAHPDRLTASADGPRGIVFVHGFLCNRAFWAPWLARLEKESRPFIAVDLEPVFGSIDAYASIIDAAVTHMRQATGRSPVLVCHSMGGIAARAWLREARDPSRVHRVITIGSPHRGTWLGRFAMTHNSSQMRYSSGWLGELVQAESGGPMPPFTCWYSNCDNIVFPTSSAMLPGADNRLVLGVAHVELAFVPSVIEESLALADAV